MASKLSAIAKLLEQRKGQGFLLVCGPKGPGKATTLYACELIPQSVVEYKSAEDLVSAINGVSSPAPSDAAPKRRRNGTPPEVVAKILADLKGGLKAPTISKKYGITPQTVYNIRDRSSPLPAPTSVAKPAKKKLGQRKFGRGNPLPAETVQAILADLKSGLKAPTIGKKHGVTTQTVYNIRDRSKKTKR